MIWGPKAAREGQVMPPLLLDDFAVALKVIADGRDLGVSIGTVSGRVPTPEELQRVQSTRQLPIEYIPRSTYGTHMGSVLLEVDRTLKSLAHGEDNVTRRSVISSVPEYMPVSQLLQGDLSMGREARPLGLWWFVPDEAGLAFEGYSIKFVRYRMRVKYKSLVSDPAVECFGKHLNKHFSSFAREFVAFQELVRLHKLVQIARWCHESRFPMDALLEYQPLDVATPQTTPMIQTPAGTIPGPDPGSYYQMYLMGGIDLSPSNYYIPAAKMAPRDLSLGHVTEWKPKESHSPWSSARPAGFGSYRSGSVPSPAFVKPIYAARPSQEAFGWTATVKGQKFAVVSIPTRTSD